MGLHGLSRDSYTSLYEGNIRTSQETHLRVSTACYRDSSTSFTYRLPQGSVNSTNSTELKLQQRILGEAALGI
jgi:hypothetical protein